MHHRSYSNCLEFEVRFVLSHSLGVGMSREGGGWPLFTGTAFPVQYVHVLWKEVTSSVLWRSLRPAFILKHYLSISFLVLYMHYLPSPVPRAAEMVVEGSVLQVHYEGG